MRVKGDVNCHVIMVFYNHYLNGHPAVLYMRQNLKKCFVFRVPSSAKELWSKCNVQNVRILLIRYYFIQLYSFSFHHSFWEHNTVSAVCHFNIILIIITCVIRNHIVEHSDTQSTIWTTHNIMSIFQITLSNQVLPTATTNTWVASQIYKKNNNFGPIMCLHEIQCR